MSDVPWSKHGPWKNIQGIVIPRFCSGFAMPSGDGRMNIRHICTVLSFDHCTLGFVWDDMFDSWDLVGIYKSDTYSVCVYIHISIYAVYMLL